MSVLRKTYLFLFYLVFDSVGVAIFFAVLLYAIAARRARRFVRRSLRIPILFL